MNNTWTIRGTTVSGVPYIGPTYSCDGGHRIVEDPDGRVANARKAGAMPVLMCPHCGVDFVFDIRSQG